MAEPTSHDGVENERSWSLEIAHVKADALNINAIPLLLKTDF